MAKKGKGCCAGCAVILALIVGTAVLAGQLIAPTASGPVKYIRFDRPTIASRAYQRLELENVVKSGWATAVYAKLTGKASDVQPGTYRVKPGMSLDDVLKSLRNPVKRMVRLPEGWWIARTATRLEREGICSAEDYIAATKKVAAEMKLESLEGRLFPDTYNLPPLTPPEEIVKLQVKTFDKKVAKAVPESANLDHALVVASMVELEAAKDEERSRIAGVIENRIKRGIPLEIDATVLYALQEWKNLPQGVVRTVKSPYNTYLNKGLPPGPIGSPGLKSIVASLKPEPHGYLYYVARPNRSHYFAATYPEHLANIRKARAEWRAAG